MDGCVIDLDQYSAIPSDLVRLQMEEKNQTGLLSRDGCAADET